MTFSGSDLLVIEKWGFVATFDKSVLSRNTQVLTDYFRMKHLDSAQRVRWQLSDTVLMNLRHVWHQRLSTKV